MKPEHTLNILRFIVAVLALVASFFVIGEEQVAKVLVLSQTDRLDSTVLLGRLVLTFRVAAVSTFVVVAWILFMFLGRYFSERATAPRRDSRIIPQAECINEVIEYLKSTQGVQSLCIWGYSLNWASNMSNYLSENRRQKLRVRLYVPDEAVIGAKFKDNNAEERKAVLRLRIGEWRKLENRQMVESVEVYVHELVPNDMGILVDDAILYYGTYDWEKRGQDLWHRRQPIHARILMKCDHESRFLVDCVLNRLRCREHDGRKV